MKRYILAIVLMASSAFATTNEISVSTILKVSKDAVQISRTSGTKLIQFIGSRWNTQTIALTTTNQALTKGSVGNAGWCYMRNLGTNGSPSAYITFDSGVTTGIVVEAGEPALFRLAPNAVVTNFTAGASSGTVDFEFTVIED